MIELEALERTVHAFHNVFHAQPILIRGLAAPEDLGGNHVLLARPAQFLQRLAHHALGFAIGIPFSVVKEVHAQIPGRRHDFLGFFHIHLVVVCYPGAKGEFREFNTRFS